MGFDLAPSQEATMSAQAAEFFRAAQPRPQGAMNNLIEFCVMFQLMEEPVEEALIQKNTIKTTQKTIAGIPVLVFEPPLIAIKKAPKVINSIHGGGFVTSIARDRAALRIAGELGIRVYLIKYSLRPQAKYPVAVDEREKVYEQLVKDTGAFNIIISPSSAGGQLSAALMSCPQLKGLPMPADVVFFTPELDLSAAGDSSVINDNRDLVPTDMMITSVKKLYLGGADPKDPMVSPTSFDFKPRFPRMVITTGTRHLLLSHEMHTD